MTESTTFDWAAVHERLAAGARSLSASFESDVQRRSMLLVDRARTLAARGEQTGQAGGVTEFLRFRVDDQRYAVELTAVRGVLPARTLGSVPGAPSELLGMLAERGEIWAVYCLRALLGLPGAWEPDEEEMILLLRHRDKRVGLRAGRMDGIAPLSSVDWHAPGAETGAKHALVSRFTDDSLALLDVEAVWSHPAILEVLK